MTRQLFGSLTFLSALAMIAPAATCAGSYRGCDAVAAPCGCGDCDCGTVVRTVYVPEY